MPGLWPLEMHKEDHKKVSHMLGLVKGVTNEVTERGE